MIEFKDGVYTSVHVIVNGVEEVRSFCPEILAAFEIANDISNLLANRNAVVTSGLDGKHKWNSKHYSGEAFDFRINHYRKNGKIDEELVNAIFEDLKIALGSGYDVVMHKGSHIHIEWDPK